MLDQRYYAIDFFSNEWWINNLVTLLFIIIFLYFGKISNKNKKYSSIFSLSIGILLLLRLIWNQWYQYDIGQWNIQWSLPLQLCSFSSMLSGILPIFIFLNVNKRTKQFMFELLFYWGLGASYGLITPVYTTGINGLIYYDYYISHGGIVFVILYCILFKGYQLRKKSWFKVFLYSQILLLLIHCINLYIGGDSNYFYTLEPPIANNPLIIGKYPTHIIMLDIFALLHFYLFYLIFSKVNNIATKQS